jgi:hypothetical protein
VELSHFLTALAAFKEALLPAQLASTPGHLFPAASMAPGRPALQLAPVRTRGRQSCLVLTSPQRAEPAFLGPCHSPHFSDPQINGALARDERCMSRNDTASTVVKLQSALHFSDLLPVMSCPLFHFSSSVLLLCSVSHSNITER